MIVVLKGLLLLAAMTLVFLPALDRSDTSPNGGPQAHMDHVHPDPAEDDG